MYLQKVRSVLKVNNELKLLNRAGSEAGTTVDPLVRGTDPQIRIWDLYQNVTDPEH
jgi:hypothetical protein